MWQQKRDTAEIFCWSLERRRAHEDSTDDELRELYFGKRERTVISEEYVRSFRGLSKLAADCDLDGPISRSVIQTPLRLVYLNMLKSLKPPSVWILLDELDPLHAREPYSMTEGKWLVTGTTLRGRESWNVTLTRGSDDDISGTFYSDGVEVSFDETAISGTAFFAKFTIAENFFIVTARATDKGMSGTIDYDGGLYGSFVGEKAALESHN